MFNFAHSPLRTVIARSFGVLKKRFPMLKMMPSYSFDTQVLIVVACVTIHNFIRKQQEQDWSFEHYKQENVITNDNDSDSDSEDDEDDVELVSTRQHDWGQFRLGIANVMEQDAT